MSTIALEPRDVKSRDWPAEESAFRAGFARGGQAGVRLAARTGSADRGHRLARQTARRLVAGRATRDALQTARLRGSCRALTEVALHFAAEGGMAVAEKWGDELQGWVDRMNPEPIPVLLADSPNEHFTQAAMPPVSTTDGKQPGDDYAERGDIRALLIRHGWAPVGIDGDNERWRRPGKTLSWSATWNGEYFYVFSSNAAPFEPSTSYRPFAVFAMLEHDGDFSAAAAELRRQGYGDQANEAGVDLAGITEDDQGEDDEPELDVADPGAFPVELLSVPGFVGDIVAYNLKTAIRPQPVLALFGALCLQAVLAARKVRDELGNRTNLYVVGLAKSGEGKGHTVKVNDRILFAAGLDKLRMPSRLASDTGLTNVLVDHPARLWQPDEFGRHLGTFADANRSPHLYGIVTTLLELYNAADATYDGKAYADPKRNVTIDQPCLVMYGTTAPDAFHAALNVQSLSDGSLARLLILQPGPMPPLRDIPAKDPPPDLVATARGWGEFRPGGNLGTEHPQPTVVKTTAEAKAVFRSLAEESDAASRKSNNWQSSVYNRCFEKACRLALIYACSEVSGDIGRRVPIIDVDAARWACAVARYCTTLLVTIASDHVCDGPFDQLRLQILRTLRDAGGGMTKRALTRALQRVRPRDRAEGISNLIECGRIEVVMETGGVKPTTRYQVKK